MFKKIQHQLELSFWDVTIQTLSQNKLARTLYRDAYRMSQEPDAFQESLSLGMTVVAGFSCGMGAYFLMALCR